MNMAFDARGRLWVSGSTEYPYPAPANRPGRDSIRVLEDTNRDGRADKVTVFADGLSIPIGLYPYKNGVIAFSIPNIWFFDDTDGDGKADRREILYGPFDYLHDTHGMNNAFRRGFDGWLYANHGWANTSTVRGRDGNEVVLAGGNTYRVRPNGARIEHFTHGQVNPFGMTFDPLGDLFNADCHTRPIMLLLRGGYYDSFGRPHNGLGYVPPVMEHSHGSTAIAGTTRYTGLNFPPQFRGNMFVGNVMTSRVNRDSVHERRASLQAIEEPDFVVSTTPGSGRSISRSPPTARSLSPTSTTRSSATSRSRSTTLSATNCAGEYGGSSTRATPKNPPRSIPRPTSAWPTRRR